MLGLTVPHPNGLIQEEDVGLHSISVSNRPLTQGNDDNCIVSRVLIYGVRRAITCLVIPRVRVRDCVICGLWVILDLAWA